ncbi:molybdate ABC transporter substrate-binding protein [Brachybacterium sp. FME24]|uniref:molybdate ABC transporter substrate-binding protein n=1 Tax=Brachybacterium sp. FME24 TaxID=2742605 RepID=UPI00186722BA|nr:molybdate ABC transporter substrate-binding protein [Brachybacterium sp. FME24]
MRARVRLAGAASGVVLALGAAGCGGGDASTTLVVYAAASLQAPFEELGEQFEAAHEDVEVEFSFAGSSTLVAQLQEGAPADVFASADTATMDRLTSAEPVDFASNTLMIAVPAGNPAHVRDLASLAREGVDLVVCAPEVPCGAASAKVEDSSGFTFAPVSEEQSVTDVLTKVTSGEADAGLVYVSDVRRAGDAVEGIEFAEAADAVNTYPITTVDGSAHEELGQEFVDLVTGGAGLAVLDEYGFAEA